MAAVRSLCKTGFVLNKGGIEYSGPANECVDFYLQNRIDSFQNDVIVTDAQRDLCFQRELEIIEVSSPNDLMHVATDEPLIFDIRIKKNDSKVKQYTIGFHVTNAQEYTVGTYISPVFNVPEKLPEFNVHLEINDHNLSKGNYSTHFNVGLKDINYGNRDYDVIHNIINFSVVFYSKNKPISLWLNEWGDILYQNVKISI